ncbi:dephospho-CoA kinase [Candidatus Woesearchaeota archaeon]|nr:dephospho-CoA kinase [Candidatus Woesearchaeota archaeon]
MILGITGNFGTGKSTVSELFRKHGFRVINVDRLYHGIYRKNLLLRLKIKKEFGTTDRKKLKEIVFNDSKKLRKLNNITHPVIIKAMKKEINKIKKLDKKETRIVVDIPLLFEAKLEKYFDKIMVVKCSKKKQIERVLKKRKYSKKEVIQIIDSQIQLKEKIKKADFVVDNDKTLRNSTNQIDIMIPKLLKNRQVYS